MRTTEASRKLQGKTPVEAMAEMMAEAVAEAARAVVAEARARQMVVPARPSHCPSVETCHRLVVVAAVVAVHQ